MRNRDYGAACLVCAAAVTLAGCSAFKTPAEKAIDDTKSLVAKELKDPESAQFGEIEACPANKEIVHGTVNSKNGFGAYTGSEMFFVIHRMPVFSSAWPAVERRGKHYSYFVQLGRACFDGADPDLDKFIAEIETGQAVAIEDWKPPRK